jgi:hypothetical protein
MCRQIGEPNMSKESAVRRKATQRGYVVRKSRRRNSVPNSDDFGDYMLIDAYRNLIALGERFDATPQDINDYLTAA